MSIRPPENPNPPSQSGGVKVFPLGTRFENERHRLAGGFTDADRAWRHQLQKDQILSPNEPRHVPEMYTELTNPIRRFYKAPWLKLEKILTPTIGAVPAYCVRYFIPKMMIGMMIFWSTAYYFKYNKNDWTRKNGVRVFYNNPPVLPGDPGYPMARYDRHVAEDYYDQGFKNRKISVD